MDVCDGMGHSVAAAAKLKQQTQAVKNVFPIVVKHKTGSVFAGCKKCVCFIAEGMKRLLL